VTDLSDDESIDGDVVFRSDESKFSDDDEDIMDPVFPNEMEKTLDGTSWMMGLPNNVRGRQQRKNIFHGIPGSLKRGLHPATAKEAFLVYDNVIIESSVLYTNLHARRAIEKSNLEKTTSKK